MKFDVFNTKTKKWVTLDEEWLINIYGELIYLVNNEYAFFSGDDDCIIVYYMDDDGEKLRDGDIYGHTKYNYKYAIGYDYEIGFCIYTPGEEFSDSQNFGYLWGCELIGNKYENPELLETT
jgi:hypothetical protein